MAVLGLGVLTSACSKLPFLNTDDDKPAAPSGPPVAGSTVVYSAVGASDAMGVGSSAVCLPYTDCPDGMGTCR